METGSTYDRKTLGNYTAFSVETMHRDNLVTVSPTNREIRHFNVTNIIKKTC